MPLYEYECEKCGERVEIIQKTSGAPIPPCPTCSGEMRKLISSPAIQFKGSGFYKTDYASSSSTKSGSKSDAKSESSTESKSEAKTDKGDKSEKSDKSDKTEKKSESKSSE
jgi:putative FmdB family regulatory protein